MGSETLTIDRVAACLDWPETAALLTPVGGGAAILTRLAQEKVGRGLASLIAPNAYRPGVLTAAPEAETTESRLAIVMEFDTSVGTEVLREAHRLAWNFSHSPTLMTIEPDILRVWTCCETPPPPDQPIDSLEVYALTADALLRPSQLLEVHAARALHWFNLVSGEFFASHAARFDRDGRADQLLLRNLRHIRAL